MMWYAAFGDGPTEASYAHPTDLTADEEGQLAAMLAEVAGLKKELELPEYAFRDEDNAPLPDGRAQGLSRQGEVEESYGLLCSVFGPPTASGDKTLAEWHLNLGGERVTIYDYKTEEGTAVEDINLWHIGGKSHLAGLRVDESIEQFLYEELHDSSDD
eukprot:SAG31_NODE_1969_length_6771_cov_17.211331_5_plen_158_part_00